ncbi:hypothetical protein GY45DRAFT_1367879 [Cubamyces sp. BRFM 1775]|nr:hypothetical protein GY45DRAFT_1367879 [Cubamyces sp. BRFM 1775]
MCIKRAHLAYIVAPSNPFLRYQFTPSPSLDSEDEAKEPIFCCGAHHKSANYHRRTVHQQHTKIYFKGHPLASFVLRRNPATSLFHCPHCDRSWAMATPIRHHIFQRCEGYAQYRSSIADKGAGEIDANQSMSSIDSEDDIPLSSASRADDASSQAKTEMDTNDAAQPVVDTNSDSAKQRPGSSGGTPETPVTGPERIEADAVDVVESPQDSPTLEKGLGFAPTLRPAIWSPVESRAPPLSATSSTRTLVDAGIPTLSFAGRQPQALSSAPDLTRSASCSSKSSVLTVPDDVFADTHPVRVKADPEDAAAMSRIISRYLPAQAEPLASPCSIQSCLLGQPAAVQRFLEGLRRPLGHAAPLFRKMGLVTEEDLDLICTMPETWNEVGAVLQAGGVTTIEWLMVKEAFKSKAKELSG